MERGNKNHNPNQNVHNILAKKCNKGPIITIFTREGERTRVDLMNGGKRAEKWVRRLVGSIPTFDLYKEKETY
jgi:hypothetical protein